MGRVSRVLAPLYFALLSSGLGWAKVHPPVEGFIPDWQEFAKRLTGESGKVRYDTIRQLRETPLIEKRIREALGTGDQPLALDVITALRLHSLVPDLIWRSSKDESGSVFLTLNTLLTEKNRALLTRLYRLRLQDEGSPLGVRVILLDILTRLKEKIPDDELEKYLRDPAAPELAASALNYLRAQIIKRGERSSLQTLFKVLRTPLKNNQLRLQAWFLAEESAKKWKWSDLSGVPCPDSYPDTWNFAFRRELKKKMR